jgi:hypothetical protein
MGISAHVGLGRSSGDSVVELQGFLKEDYYAAPGLRV